MKDICSFYLSSIYDPFFPLQTTFQTNKLFLKDDTKELFMLWGSVCDYIEVMFKMEAPVF